MSDRHSPADLAGNPRVLWLLDLVYAGMTLRLAEDEAEVEDDDGNAYRYAEGLGEIEADEEMDLLADSSASGISIPIDAFLPINVPRLVALGHDLGAATGVLYRWIEGTTLNAARVVCRGVVSDPLYGAEDEPVSFSLESLPWDGALTLPRPDQRVLRANWDDAMYDSLPAAGLRLAYPIVIGRPGKVSTAVYYTGKTTGSQGVYVDQQSGLSLIGNNIVDLTCVVAGHHVTAGTVYCNTPTAVTPIRLIVKNGFDRSGHPVAFLPWWATKTPASTDDFTYDVVVDTAIGYTWSTGGVSSLGDASINASFQPLTNTEPAGLYVVWIDDDDATAGGLAAKDGTTMRAAGDVIEWLLEQAGQPVDHGRFAAVAPLLAAFKLDFTIDEGVELWKWLQDEILPLLPVSIVEGPNGAYPIAWRHDATAADAVCRIDTGIDPGIERMGSVQFDRSKILNEFDIAYAPSIRTSNLLGSMRMAATSAAGAIRSQFCQLSVDRYRRSDGSPMVASKSITTNCIYDDATATAVLQWMSAAYALARRRVAYSMDIHRYGHLERGQVVTLTDAELYFEEQVCLIEGITTDDSDTIEMTLLLVEHPGRDQRLGQAS